MERKPPVQPEFNAGDGETFLPLMESDEAAFMNGMFDGISYQSILSLSLDNSCYYDEAKPSFHTPPLVNDHMLYATAASEIQQSSVTFGDLALVNTKTTAENTDADDQKLKFPKLEPVVNDAPPLQLLYPYNNEFFWNEPPLNYLSNTSDGGFGYHMNQLPDLSCLEQPNYLDFHYGDSSSSSLFTNRVEPVPVHVSQVMNNNLRKNRQQPYASSSTARLQRQKLSEKMRCLGKLLPWDKKMDTATMLEEAYKYVKFLQAQISVLQNMPPLSEGGSASSSSDEGKNGIIFGKLGRLNRQQLLQVVLNSPVAQTYLYSKGCCVYSVEQLVQYRKIAQRNALYRQILFFSGMLS